MIFDAIHSAYGSGPKWKENYVSHYDAIMNTRFQTYTGNGYKWIVFRATQDDFNWFTNFLIAKRTIPYNNKDTKIKIHLGFLLGYTHYLRSKIHEIVKEHPNDKYILLGHSLGGALARLSAIDIQYNFGVQSKVRVLGCPNIGNKEFEESFAKRMDDFKSYRTTWDVVGMLPLGYGNSSRIKVKGDKKFWRDHDPIVYQRNITEDIWTKG